MALTTPQQPDAPAPNPYTERRLATVAVDLNTLEFAFDLVALMFRDVIVISAETVRNSKINIYVISGHCFDPVPLGVRPPIYDCFFKKLGDDVEVDFIKRAVECDLH